MNHEDAHIAWAAGLFEGEGCFTRTGKPGVYGRQCFCAIMMNADEDVMARFAEIVAVGRICGYKQRSAKKELTIWRCDRRVGREAFIAMMWPWLGQRRRSRITELQAEADLPSGTVSDAWRTRRRNCNGQFEPTGSPHRSGSGIERSAYCVDQ